MRGCEIKVLNELREIIDEVGFDEGLLEYGVTFRRDLNFGFVDGVLPPSVIYFVKIKSTNELILKSRTFAEDSIPYLQSEALKEILTNIKSIYYPEKLNEKLS